MKKLTLNNCRGAVIAVVPILALAVCFTGVVTANYPAAAQEKAKVETERKSDDELKEIAVKAVPGKAVDVAIERKLGANRYVVEVLSTADGGAEVDVIIDMNTYKVIGIDK